MIAERRQDYVLAAVRKRASVDGVTGSRRVFVYFVIEPRRTN